MRRHRARLAALAAGAAALLLVPLAIAVPPAVSITSGPSGVVVSASATFDFTVDDPGATVECSLDGGGFSGCSSGVGYSGLGDGGHTFTVQATNGGAETGSDSRSWTVDTTGPTLSLADVVENVNAVTPPVPVTYSADASDPNGPVMLTCTPASGSSFPFGITTVNCNATDGVGNSSSGSFTVTVQDVTAPSLSTPGDIVDSVNGATSATVSFSVTSNEGTPSCTPSSGSSFTLGTTTVNCSATDASGNTGTASFTVTVQDTTPPTLTLPGNQTVNVNGVSAATVTYSATASDGGTALTPTCAPASGSSFVLGTTSVSCSVTDAAGNTSSGSFTVTVQDTTPPTLTLPGTVTKNINAATSTTVTYTATAADGPTSITPDCTPPSGSSFSLGTTPVSCTATDASGNVATGGFSVVVQDTTAPTVSITSGPSGAVASAAATFSFTTNEGTLTCSLDGGGFSACSSPKAYPSLADGSHTFRARATDAAGNTATATRSWSIDATPPVLTTPGTLPAEANGPSGSVVTYTVTGSDAGLALLPSAITCAPLSGTLFPIGTTPVSCSAADALDNVGTATFDVVVQDTTAPTLTAADITVAAIVEAGIRREDPAMAAYLRSLSATDLVSAAVVVTTNAPDLFPVGQTPLLVTARDDAGNASERTVRVTVLPLGQVAPPPPDLTPPADVTGVRATAGDHRVDLRWVPPQDDLAAVEVMMTVAGEQGGGRVVYRGLRGAAAVAGLRNDVEHRFVLVSVDKSGNRSRGVVALATPRTRLLASPKPGSKVTKPPLLRWAPVPGASYFNVQLYRGKTKILSAWPTVARLQLKKTWVYDRAKRTLAPGAYIWYVWPGLGSRAEARYGPPLGKSTFTVVKGKG